MQNKLLTSNIVSTNLVHTANINASAKTTEANLLSQALLKIGQGEIQGTATKVASLIAAFKYAKVNFKLKDTINKSAAEQLLSYYWIKVIYIYI